MAYERILVIGSPGSGKTTFSLRLGEALAIPVVHLDRLNRYGNWQTRTKDDFEALLREALASDRFIVDGNYARTLPMRLERCDTVVFLDYPTVVSLFGVLSRIIRNHGKTRPDMGGNCPERFDAEFICYTLSFNRKNRRLIKEMLNKPPDKRIFMPKSRRQAERVFSEITNASRTPSA